MSKILAVLVLLNLQLVLCKPEDSVQVKHRTDILNNYEEPKTNSILLTRLKRQAFGGGLAGGFAGFGGSPLLNNYGGWANPRFQKKNGKSGKTAINKRHQKRIKDIEDNSRRGLLHENWNLMLLSNSAF